MSSNSRNLRKTALCIAMGLCLSSIAVAPALAQSADRRGRRPRRRRRAGHRHATPPPASSRTVTADADGNYRFAPAAGRRLHRAGQRGGQAVGAPVAVNVSPGRHDHGQPRQRRRRRPGHGAGGRSRVVNRVDVHSTESATNITREELARLPVDQTPGSVALLAPGVVASGATFGGLTFGGSSVAENAVYINGLNVTDFYNRVGLLVGAVRVLRGIPGQDRRLLGGVRPHHRRRDQRGDPLGQQRIPRRRRADAGTVGLAVASGGPLPRRRHHRRARPHEPRRQLVLQDQRVGVRPDREGPPVLLRACTRGATPTRSDIDTTEACYDRAVSNGFWGAKLDWQINDDHLLELLAFSDKADSTTDNYDYDWDTDTLGDHSRRQLRHGSGGDNWSLTYTGHFTDNFVAKAMYGVNKRSALSGSPRDADCSIVARAGTYTAVFGRRPSRKAAIRPTASVSNRCDEREAARLDFEWTLGDHLLRFGVDQEMMDSDSSTRLPGRRRAATTAQAADARRRASQRRRRSRRRDRLSSTRAATSPARRFETEAQAFYIEDNWNVTAEPAAEPRRARRQVRQQARRRARPSPRPTSAT